MYNVVPLLGNKQDASIHITDYVDGRKIIRKKKLFNNILFQATVCTMIQPKTRL